MRRSAWLILTLLATTVLPERAQSPSSDRRAHLLLSERDAFSSFAALRARYASGSRPSDDACGNALTWLLDGRREPADRALTQISAAPPRPGSGSYPFFVCRALAYDWLYGYDGFPTALKDRIGAELVAAAERMFADPSLREPSAVSYQNYPVRYLALASFALAAAADHPPLAARVAPLAARTRQSFDTILRTSDFLTPDGSYHESMDYMRITMAAMVLMAELRRTTDGDDPAWQHGVFRNITRTYLYKVHADGTSSREGDDEYPPRHRDDNVVLGYAVHRFKDPYAAWMLRESGWGPPEWRVPVLAFLWSDQLVTPRDPARTDPAELPRHHWFHGVDHVVLRDGWQPDSTWIQFLAGPFAAKHQHMDRNAFTIERGGHLAIDSGADYTDTESPHYLNYFRRTVAHNTLLVYQPGETFFWGEDLWRAANDGGQRMDSSRYWNTIRNVEDWQRTRDLWDVAHVEAASFHDGEYQYARGNATGAYARTKVSLFTRELLYLPSRGVLAVYDRVRSPLPSLKKVWLLHGVNRPDVQAPSAARDVGHGGTSYGAATMVTFADGDGVLRVHPVLPMEREVVVRGGDGWEFWTPGDERGGDWGSGQNWPLDPPQGGPLPSDPYLLGMWKTFWGDDFAALAPSNRKGVVPGSWRMEVTAATPRADERFLHVLEIAGRNATPASRIEALEGVRLSGSVVDDLLLLFPRDEGPLSDAEITLPPGGVREACVAGLRPHSTYELQWTALGIPKGRLSGETDDSGVLHLMFEHAPEERLRFRLVNEGR